MKLAVICLLLILVTVVPAQHLKHDGELYTLTNVSTDVAVGHMSGNEFAQMIGDLLKKQFPSRVIDPGVELVVFSKNGKIYFQHTWRCRLVKVAESQADYYFDRRGTLLQGFSPKSLQLAVEKQIQATGKVQQLIASFERQFGNHRMPNSFASHSMARDGNQFWLIEEYFITAQRNKQWH